MKIRTTAFYCPVCQTYRTGTVIEETRMFTIVRCFVCKANSTIHEDIENDQS